jgi:hypothetical protein
LYFKHYILSNRGAGIDGNGILVAVGILASYFYIKNVKDTEMDNAGNQVSKTVSTLTQKSRPVRNINY